jgi:hypothetical protein
MAPSSTGGQWAPAGGASAAGPRQTVWLWPAASPSSVVPGCQSLPPGFLMPPAWMSGGALLPPAAASIEAQVGGRERHGEAVKAETRVVDGGVRDSTHPSLPHDHFPPPLAHMWLAGRSAAFPSVTLPAAYQAVVPPIMSMDGRRGVDMRYTTTTMHAQGLAVGRPSCPTAASASASASAAPSALWPRPASTLAGPPGAPSWQPTLSMVGDVSSAAQGRGGPRQRVVVHTATGSGPPRYKCRYCEYVADSANLVRHERTHTGEKPFKCPFEGCTYRYDVEAGVCGVRRGVGRRLGARWASAEVQVCLFQSG